MDRRGLVKVAVRLLFLAAAATSIILGQEDHGAARVHEYNRRLEALIGARDVSPAVVRRLLGERRAIFEQLIRADPKAALSATLPEGVRANLAGIAQSRQAGLEQRGEWTGGARVAVEDDFEHGSSRTVVELEVGAETLEVSSPDALPDITCGQSLTVKGLRVGRMVLASAVQAGPKSATGCPSTGQQPTVVILVTYPSAGLPANVTPAFMTGATFGSGRSFQTYVQEASYGKITVTGTVVGPYMLSTDFTCDQTTPILNAAIQAADADIDFRQFRRIVVVMPNRGSCSIGTGSVGCWSLSSAGDGSFSASVAWLRADILTSNDHAVGLMNHEIGHGFGLEHAGTMDYGTQPAGVIGASGVFTEYGDYSSAMGSLYTFNGQPILGHYAAPHKSQLGWLSGAGIQQVETAGTFTILPYEQTTAGLQALSIRRGSGVNQWLWAEYRQSTGSFDPTISLWSSNIFSGAWIHLDDQVNTSFTGYSKLLDFTAAASPGNFSNAALTAGNSWSDPYSPLTIQVNSATAGGLNLSVSYDSSCASLVPGSATHNSPAGSYSVAVNGASNCSWTASTSASWISITGGQSGSGTGTISYSVTQNTSSTRVGYISVARQVFTVTQLSASACSYALGSSSQTFTPAAGSGSVGVTVQAGCPWSAVSNAGWLTITGGGSGSGNGTVSYSVAANTGAQRVGTLTIAGLTFTVTQSAAAVSTGLRFVPVTPCRIMDTRSPAGPFGGPSITGGSTRNVAIPSSGCGIPTSAAAYSLNVTVVPSGVLSYLTLWPTGQSQPGVSTLNSFDGRIKANAAVVPAGSSGQVSVFVTHTTDVLLDINGYFVPASGSSNLAFYPVTPCRITDTRSTAGPFGGPSMTAGQTRSFTIPSAGCGIPASAQAYALNMTVVPPGPLSFLTTWPAGQAQPVVSTLNAFTGAVTANAAIVPAGSSGAVSVYVTHQTDLLIDINGYFAPPGSPGELLFYPVSPCRISDTRNAAGPFGGPAMAAGQTRSYPVTSSGCGLPSAAKAYSLNATVVPSGPLAYLTLWPTGQSQPSVSTLNAFDGSIVSNAAIVPAGTSGSVTSFVTNLTDLILDVNGYFAP